LCGYRRCGVFVSEVSFFTFSFGSVRADPFLLDHPVYVNQTRIIAVSNLTQSFRYEDGGGMSWMVSASAYKNILCHPEDHSRVPLPVLNTVAARCSETSVAVCTRLHGVEDGTVAQAVIRRCFTLEAQIRQLSMWIFALGFAPSTWAACCRHYTNTAYSFTYHRRHIISAVGVIVKNNAYPVSLLRILSSFTAASKKL